MNDTILRAIEIGMFEMYVSGQDIKGLILGMATAAYKQDTRRI
jgi:hypothetical protein